MSITIKSGAKVLYQWERGVALTASTPCDILRISREDDCVTDDLYPVISGSTGTALIPDRMLTESGYLHVSRIDHADGSERVLETVRILVRHAAKPQNTASSTKEISDIQAIRMQMAALERAAREGKFDGKDGTTPHIGENGNWFAGDVDLGIRAQGEKGDKGDPGDTPYVGANGNWFVGDTDTGVMAKSADVHMYADDMYTSGVLGAESFIAEAQEGTMKVVTSPGVAYIKGVRRKLAKDNKTYAVTQNDRISANILRLEEATGKIGYAKWRDVAISGDIDNGGTITDLDTGETLPLRSGGYYDLILCIVNLPAGTTAVTQDMIRDLRGDERYCGYIKDKLAPTKVSELENDSGFITSLVSDLANYYTKTETAEMISSIPKFAISVVDSLPTTGISETTVYLVRSGAGDDLYTEYIYVGGVWEVLGAQRVDLTGYATEEWVNQKVQTPTTLAQQAYGRAENAQATADEAKIAAGKLQQGVDKVSEAVGGKANSIVDIATGEVLALTDSAEAPLSGLVVYGKSTQDGTPTPDAPVPIVSAGDDGSVDIGVYGANLIRFPYHSQNNTSQGITWTINKDGSVTANGTATANSHFALTNKIVWHSTSFNVLDTPKTINGITFSPELNYNSDNQQLYITVKSGETVTDKTFYPMANYGNTLKPYEPYKPAQTLPVSTPDGLCGIPVRSGGNYTDASGQQWVCDEVDFARGKYVQRVKKERLTSTGQKWAKSGLLSTRYIWDYAAGIARVAPMCSHYPCMATGVISDKNVLVNNSGRQIYVNTTFESISEWQTWLDANDVWLAYALATPIEHDLSAEELAQYAAMRTNYPNTTIYADDNAGLSVRYSADTKHYIDKKFAELAAAIVNN